MSEDQRERLLPATHHDVKEEPALFLGFKDRMNIEYVRNIIHLPPQAPLKEHPEQGASNDPTITLDYVYFPLKLVKTQKRENKVSMQRIEDAKVSFALDFQNAENKSNVGSISVSVKRTNESSNPLKYVGPVPIPKIDVSHIQDTKMLVKLDLDSVHIHNDKKVYELDRNNEEGNLFHLIIYISFTNNKTVKQNTRPFRVIGRKLPGGSKRTYSESITSPGSVDSGGSGVESNKLSRAISISSKTESPAYDYSPSVFLSPDCEDNIGLIEARMIVADHIKTKFLDVDGESINLNKALITTPNGDIAYHFLLENDDDEFEEGEIVGFVPDQLSDAKLVLTKLTFKSASLAILKGVVTRSQYLEAQKPSPGVRSETIAMMGIVPVQVRGSVCANEPLYASPYYPGFAVSGQHLDTFSIDEAAFIGYAFSARKADNEESAGMVQAAVSVLQSAGQKLLNGKIKELEDHFEEKIIKISRFGRRTRRCMCFVGIGIMLIFILVALLLWQLLTPGTALRYAICESGRSTPHASATFFMQPLRDPLMKARVNGVEFTFDALMEKAGHQVYPRLNGTGNRYYLNTDRCAYGYVTRGDILRGEKPVRGPTVFVIDEKCFRVYYFSESSFRWKVYNSSSWTHYQNICCQPRSRWKTCKEIKKSQCSLLESTRC